MTREEFDASEEAFLEEYGRCPEEADYSTEQLFFIENVMKTEVLDRLFVYSDGKMIPPSKRNGCPGCGEAKKRFNELIN